MSMETNSPDETRPEEALPSQQGATSVPERVDATWPQVERRSGLDRRLKRHYVFLDHRTGFDRRKKSWFFGSLRDNSGLLIGLLVLLNLLSLIDGMLTAFELRLGIATEGNPLFDNVIQTNGFLAAGLKVMMMIVVAALIWRWRAHRSILALVPFALALYAALIAYHLGSLAGFH